MCRFAAYVGPKTPLSSLLYDPVHSLEHQSYAAAELIWGNVNVDGTGVAWWAEDSNEPLRYVTTEPPWKDPNLPALAPRIESRAIVAAVRSATAGIPFGSGNVAPFVRGRLACVHNGWIQGFRGPVGRELMRRLPDHLYAEVDVINDSKALFLTIVRHHEDGLGSAVRTALAEVQRLVRDHDLRATLNVAISDGERIVATRHSVDTRVNTLYVAARNSGHLVASEPIDDEDDWKPIPEGHLVEATALSLSVTPLEE